MLKKKFQESDNSADEIDGLDSEQKVDDIARTSPSSPIRSSQSNQVVTKTREEIMEEWVKLHSMTEPKRTIVS